MLENFTDRFPNLKLQMLASAKSAREEMEKEEERKRPVYEDQAGNILNALPSKVKKAVLAHEQYVEVTEASFHCPQEEHWVKLDPPNSGWVIHPELVNHHLRLKGVSLLVWGVLESKGFSPRLRGGCRHPVIVIPIPPEK